MVRIIVVCGAGASSTFVAHRIRRAAAARGIDVRATATSDSAVEGALGDADVLLVGAHLGERIGALRERAAAASVPIVILEEGAATARDPRTCRRSMPTSFKPTKEAPPTTCDV